MTACPTCAAEQPAGAKFCIECGAPQQTGCPSCGTAVVRMSASDDPACGSDRHIVP